MLTGHYLVLNNLAGFPTIILLAGNDLVTIAPAPTIQPSPNVTPFKMTELAPIQQYFPIVIGFDIPASFIRSISFPIL